MTSWIKQKNDLNFFALRIIILSLDQMRHKIRKGMRTYIPPQACLENMQ